MSASGRGYGTAAESSAVVDMRGGAQGGSAAGGSKQWVPVSLEFSNVSYHGA
jgi:hypothetical protein